MSGDLIRRQDAIAKFKKTCTYESIDKNGIKRGEIHSVMTYEKIIKIIESLPSAEPEQKKGKWWHYEGMLTCSECGMKFYDDIEEYCGDDVPKFCPECGADMRCE